MAKGSMGMGDVEVTVGGGNVFADLGLPDPEERSAKADLAIRIESLIEERGFTQSQAAQLMGLTQPQVSDIVRGRVRRFTFDKLIACLNALDQDVEIVIRRAGGVGNLARSRHYRFTLAGGTVANRSIVDDAVVSIPAPASRRKMVE